MRLFRKTRVRRLRGRLAEMEDEHAYIRSLLADPEFVGLGREGSDFYHRLGLKIVDARRQLRELSA